MDAYRRQHPRFAACGLNCGLCPRHHTDGVSRCPGCGGEDFFANRPSCGVITCCRRHGVEFCFQCEDFPCERHEGRGCVDSFISYRNVMADQERARADGLDAYLAALDARMAVLRLLLDRYNDGRRKGLFCQAANLLPMEDLAHALGRLEAQTPPDEDIKGRAKRAVGILEDAAQARGISLKLQRK